MLREDEFVCNKCGGEMRHYDGVKRKVVGKRGAVRWVVVERRKCQTCGSVQRVQRNDILPYKQYEAEIIQGVQEGYITSDTLGFEDYPCELTMKAWNARKIHTSL